MQLLSSDDDIAGCKAAIEDGKRAQKKLVEANLRLVVSIANKYASEKMDLLGIIQEGNIGLMKAASKFNIALGFRFSTYATWWIKQAIQRGINKFGNPIRVSEHMRESIRKIKKAQAALSFELGREATNAEVAAYLNMKLTKVEEILGYSRSVTSLEAPVGKDGETSLQELIEDTVFSPEKKAMESFKRNLVDSVIDSLPERQAGIVRLLYGFKGRSYTLDEVGKIYGLSRERIRQIGEDALRRIRRNKNNYNQLKDYCIL